MTDLRLVKIFAWTIGVLSLLWLLAQCLGGADPVTDPEGEQLERDLERYAADCERAWEALELLGEADHETIDRVVEEIEILASEITDPGLSSSAYSFAARAEEIVAATEPGDTERLEESYELYRGLAEMDLTLRCSGRSPAVD